MSRFAAVALSVLVLAGCTTESAYKGNDYASLPPTRMSVAAVLVDSAFKPSGTEPNIEQNLQPQPEDALRTALTQHYAPARPAGAGASNLRFVIKDASVIENRLTPESKNAFTNIFSDKPQYKYTGRLEVESRTEGVSRRGGFVHAEATRVLDVKSGDAAERGRLVQGMVAQMVDDIIAQLDQQMNANMGGYIISGADMSITPQASGRWDHVYEDRVARSAGMRVITTK